jgi:S-adenosyl methyltransferase
MTRGAAVARYVSTAAPGSFLALSHGCSDPDPDRAATGAELLYSAAIPVAPRSRAEIRTFFGGLEMVQPGLVPVQRWRPDDPGAVDPGKIWLLGGVGRKPS